MTTATIMKVITMMFIMIMSNNRKTATTTTITRHPQHSIVNIN